MTILESYADDLAALEAAITLVESDPLSKDVGFEFPFYGAVFIRLFAEARDEILEARDLKITHEPNDHLHALVVCLARATLSVAYEAQAGEK